MASDVGNGSTLTFASGLLGDLQSIGVTINGNPVDLTDLADARMVYLNGIPDIEITCQVTGKASQDTSTAAGTLAIAWFDGSSESLSGNYIISNRSTTVGGVNQAIQTSLTFKPSA